MKYKWRYILFLLFLISVDTEMAEEIEITLEEVLEMVNFSREIIEDGELNVIYFESPECSELLSEREATQRAKAEFEQWKRGYEKERENIDPATDKLNLQNAIAKSEGYIKYLTQGKVIYEEQNIAFRVKSDADLTDPHDCMLYRLYSVDRYDRSHNESPHNNRYLIEHRPLSFDYHNLLVVNREYRVSLMCGIRVSHGSVESAAPSRIHIPFNLIGRIYVPIPIEDIVDHGWEETERGRYFTMTSEPEVPADMKAVATRIGRVSGKAWLDPKLDFCVVREEHYLHNSIGKFKVAENTYSEYQLFAGDIWFPGRIEGRTYSFTEPEKIDYSFSYIVQEADFNIGIPLDFFDLDVKEVLSTGIEIMPYNH